MATGLIYDDRFLDHDTGPRHPERPDRLRAIVDKLKAAHLWHALLPLPVEPVDLRWVHAIHSPQYVDRLRLACERGDNYIDDGDCPICPASYHIARLAAGGVVNAVDAVMSGTAQNAFCAVRPPGHHAEHDRAMGFCLLANVAIAANYAVAHHGLSRVAIVDFDVHHGNGTQHLLEHRRDVLFISLHEHPSYQYPGTGFGWEKGNGAGEGFTINIALDPGSGDDAYRAAMNAHVLPALNAFRPELLLLSAGFDAAATDPLGHQQVTAEGFAWMTRQLKNVADKHCAGRVVSVLEGGYDLPALAEAVALHVGILMHPVGDDGMMAMKAGF
jgi:acetoin utilization deacetylase AcuC-like enzyme